MSEIADFATLVLIVAGGFTVAVLSTKLTERIPVLAPALFLVAAAVVSDLWPALYEHVPIRVVERVAVVALVVILFNGGIDIGLARLRGALGPVLSLGLVGTFLTAGGSRSSRTSCWAWAGRSPGSWGLRSRRRTRR